MSDDQTELWTVEERAKGSATWSYLGTFPDRNAAGVYVIRVREQWKGKLFFRVVRWERAQ